MPDEAPMLTVPVLVLSHVPPPGVAVNVLVVDTHTAAGPLMADNPFTVTILVAIAPQLDVNEIVAVPAAIPVTVTGLVPPEAVAMVASLELHVPVPELLNDVVEPWHTVAVPVIAAAAGQ